MINLLINDQRVSVQEGTTVLAAARKLKINIPTLCNHDDLCVAGNCRVCIVEQKGARTLIASCATPASEGMEIHTNTLKVRNARKHIVELSAVRTPVRLYKMLQEPELRTSVPGK